MDFFVVGLICFMIGVVVGCSVTLEAVREHARTKRG